jgi:PAS domain S-box-containing protein
VSEEHYALASMAADDGTWDWDVSKGTVYYSPRWKQTLGYDDDSVGSSPTEWLDRVHPADRDEVSTAIAASLAGVDSTLELEHRVRSAGGDYRWLLCRAMTVLDDAGCPARLVGTIVDVTDRKQTELSQQRDALRDADTGLATRLLFLDRLGAAVVRAHRIDDYDCALVVVRAPQGGQSGGARGAASSGSLREVAERLRDAVRAGDTAARSSEDEVALLLEDTGPSGVPSRVRGVLDALVTAMGDRVRVGIVPSLRGYEDTGAVLREADIAVARAAAGRVARSAPR